MNVLYLKGCRSVVYSIPSTNDRYNIQVYTKRRALLPLPPTSIYAHLRTLLHLGSTPRQIEQLPIIHLDTPQNPHAHLFTPKHGSYTPSLTVKPKVSTVAYDALGEWVFSSLGEDFLGAGAVEGGGDESVDAEYAFPLRKAGFFAGGVVAWCACCRAAT